MQIVISNGLANFVTTFSDLAVTVTFGNFSKEFENFLWNILVSMMSKVNIRQSTADFWQSWSKFLSFTRGFYSILSTSLLKLPEISNNWFWLGCSNICKSISSDILSTTLLTWSSWNSELDRELRTSSNPIVWAIWPVSFPLDFLSLSN